jgi:hypothetical protein
VFQLRLIEGLDSLEVTLLCSGLSAINARLVEHLLRPAHSIGWNMAIGGGNKQELAEAKSRLSLHPEYYNIPLIGASDTDFL